eukprot:282107-Prorocentrum_minimum.AAC.1
MCSLAVAACLGQARDLRMLPCLRTCDRPTYPEYHASTTCMLSSWTWAKGVSHGWVPRLPVEEQQPHDRFFNNSERTLSPQD